MNHRILIQLSLAAGLFLGGAAAAQQGSPPQPAPANPNDVIPEKLPFNVPYGAPISLEKAQAAIAAAMEEANKRGWPLNITVVDSGSNLVAFVRMDGAMLASIAISQHKARASAKFRRPTRVYEDSILKSGFNYTMTLDDVIAARGGIPLIEDGKLIGAIGCSGGTGSQDEAVCTAGAAAINK